MKKLLILSGKGGTGKTTVAASFIDLLKTRNFADCDVDAPNLHIVAGLNCEPEHSDYLGSQKAYIQTDKCIGCGICAEKCRFNAIQIADGAAHINEYACEGCGVCLYVCPQGAPLMQDDVAGDKMLYRGERVFSTAKLKMGRGNSGKLVTEVKNALYKASSTDDIAVIDGSPGIGCPVIASVSGVNLVLIVAEPSVSGIHDMERVLKTADILGVKTAVCINKYDVCRDYSEKIETYCRDNDVYFAGLIPYDPQAVNAANSGHSLVSHDCPAAKAIKEVFSKILELIIQ